MEMDRGSGTGGFVEGPILPSLESQENTPLLDHGVLDIFRPQAIHAPPWHTRNVPAVLAELFLNQAYTSTFDC